MAFVLIILGAIVFVTAIQGTTADFGKLLAQDVFGGFIWWMFAILFIGGLGYIKQIRPLTDSFLVLLVLVLLVANRGFFAKINEAINTIKSQASTASNSLSVLPSSQTSVPTSGGLG